MYHDEHDEEDGSEHNHGSHKNKDHHYENPYEGDENFTHGMFSILDHSELERMKNFKKISDDCKVFEEEFRACLDAIPQQVWEEDEINKCVGKDFTRIVNKTSISFIF
jgi:hypothetical protein